MPDESPTPLALLREAVPTTPHATALFDLVVERLGARAHVQTSNGGKNRILYVRARDGGPFLFPWPLLQTSIADGPAEGEDPADADRVVHLTPDPLGRPVPLPLEFHVVPASLTIHDGPLNLTVNYRWNGRGKDGCQPAEMEAFADLVPVLSPPTDGRLERLATWIAAVDLGRHGPARVLLPRATPGGVEGAWLVARAAIRAALASGRAPAGSFWVAADGFSGTAVAFGASREAVLAAWRSEVERVRPRPPPPPAPSALEAPDDVMPREWTPDAPEAPEAPTGIQIVFGGWDAPPLDTSPAFVPGAVVRLARVPETPPPRGEWTRWLGDRGTTHFAARWPVAGGYTLVGEALFPYLDPRTLDRTLDALDDANPLVSRGEGIPEHPGRRPHTHVTLFYRCFDAATGLPEDPRLEQSQIGGGFDARGFDGSRLRSYVVRVKALE